MLYGFRIVSVTRRPRQLSAWQLILIGLLFAGQGSEMGKLAYLGVFCFGLSTLFQVITLPVEFDASRRALRAIENAHILTEEELSGARKVLTAAALTYVAALAVSLTQLFRLLAIVNRRNGRESNLFSHIDQIPGIKFVKHYLLASFRNLC